MAKNNLYLQGHPFADLAPTPVEHFKLHLYGAILTVLAQVSHVFGSPQAAYEHYPFLMGYADELAAHGIEDCTDGEALARWQNALGIWEKAIPGHLPLRALCDATAMDYATVTLLLCVGLIEEDARFGLLFEALQMAPGQHRPTVGLLNTWWREQIDHGEVRTTLRRLQDLGLVQVVNLEAPRSEWALQAPALLWDVLRGETHEKLTPWARYHVPERLLAVDEFIVPEALRQSLETIPALLASGEAGAVIVRGPRHNGRRTVCGAVAHQLGCGMLEMIGLQPLGDERWRLIGPLATMLRALPVLVLDLGPGENAELPALSGYDGPLGIVLGPQGGICGAGVERALTVTLELPDEDTRRLHWVAGCGTHAVSELEQISKRVRMTGGNIRRAAPLAHSYAALAGRAAITLADVQQASRILNRQVLETLAVYVPASGDWSQLAVNEETFAELRTLESRCRYREQLQAVVNPALGAQLNPGVRALFSGPSGTGKTLAARLLASALQMDLYRLDLSAVVNKYIGETEKNLNQVFARAEELDVMLLLDEGDALMTQRTEVQTANDRYANLETNYLLQRIEAFTGILIVTTNAAERIDRAFQRRMDVVIDFRPPDVAERWVIWQLHLPSIHAVPQALLEEVAHRCTLSGGQIRNAVLHASLLALDDGGVVTAAHLEAAVQREYHKSGAVCPLRRAPQLSVVRG